MLFLNKISKRLLLILFIIFAFILLLLSLTIGSHHISITRVFSLLLKYTSSFFTKKLTGDLLIIVSLRLPRIILSFIIGGVLAVSGLIYQTLLKNSLAEPFTLGISSGATFGVAIAIYLSSKLHIDLALFPFAFVGGIITILIILLFSFNSKISIFSLIFIGISMSYFFNAFLTLFLSLLGNRSYQVLIWMFGSFQNPPPLMQYILFIVLVVFGFIVIFFYHRHLDAFYFTSIVTKSLGVNINVSRTILLGLTSILTIFAVSICGIIGFVGLIVPHIAKMLFGNKHRILIPTSIIIGGILLLASDDLARSVVSYFSTTGKELPIGVITSLIGVPFFLYILLKSRRKI